MRLGNNYRFPRALEAIRNLYRGRWQFKVHTEADCLNVVRLSSSSSHTTDDWSRIGISPGGEPNPLPANGRDPFVVTHISEYH